MFWNPFKKPAPATDHPVVKDELCISLLKAGLREAFKNIDETGSLEVRVNQGTGCFEVTATLQTEKINEAQTQKVIEIARSWNMTAWFYGGTMYHRDYAQQRSCVRIELTAKTKVVRA